MYYFHITSLRYSLTYTLHQCKHRFHVIALCPCFIFFIHSIFPSLHPHFLTEYTRNMFWIYISYFRRLMESFHLHLLPPLKNLIYIYIYVYMYRQLGARMPLCRRMTLFGHVPDYKQDKYTYMWVVVVEVVVTTFSSFHCNWARWFLVYIAWVGVDWYTKWECVVHILVWMIFLIVHEIVVYVICDFYR